MPLYFKNKTTKKAKPRFIYSDSDSLPEFEAAKEKQRGFNSSDSILTGIS